MTVDHNATLSYEISCSHFPIIHKWLIVFVMQHVRLKRLTTGIDMKK